MCPVHSVTHVSGRSQRLSSPTTLSLLLCWARHTESAEPSIESFSLSPIFPGGNRSAFGTVTSTATDLRGLLFGLKLNYRGWRSLADGSLSTPPAFGHIGNNLR